MLSEPHTGESATLPMPAEVPDRAVLHLSGADARTLLDNTTTGGISRLSETNRIVHTGLLTPQGKILFAFFVVQTNDGFLIDTDAASSAPLTARLTMYRLRSDATIAPARAATSDTGEDATGWRVALSDARPDTLPDGAIAAPDPRSDALPWRLYVPSEASMPIAPMTPAHVGHVRDIRVRAGVAELGADYESATTFPHEANWDQDGSVDFKKGCFIGQEVVSRTQHKAVAKRRFTRVAAANGSGTASPLVTGATITAGPAKIGAITTVASDGREALAALRLDRAVEAIEAGTAIHAGDAVIEIAAAALEAYRVAAAANAQKVGL
ncbi:MAG: folate-binding protein [Pseudomonadota bacterium]